MPTSDLSSSNSETYWQGIENQGAPDQRFSVYAGDEAITIYQDAASEYLDYCIGRQVFLTAEQDVTIYANRVYILAGESRFAGQTITIHAREIGTVGPSGVPALIVVDGTAGDAPAPKLPNPAPAGADGRSCSNGEMPPPTDGEPGAPGQPGKVGAIGSKAGSILLQCYAVLPDTRLQLSAVGGLGGGGQDGQDATNGGHGGGSFHYSMAPSGNGGNGGDGGAGGEGGAGGAGGTVELFCVSPLPPSAVISVNTLGGAGGGGGLGGVAGAAGAAGVVDSAMPGVAGHAGQAGHTGSPGGTGAAGQTGSQNIAATAAGYTPPSSYTAALYAASLNSNQCEMAIERALMLYLEADGSIADPLFAQVYDALSLYAFLYDQGYASLAEPLNSILAQASGYVVQLNSKLDVYGRPYNYVPLVSYNEYDALLSAQLALFGTIETAFNSYFSSLQDQAAAANYAKACISNIEASIDNNQARSLALLQEATELVPGIEAADTAVTQARAALDKAFAQLQATIEKAVSCSWANTVEALAMSILGGGKVSAASLITAALHASSNYNPNVVPVGPAGGVSKAYLVNQVQFVESDVQSIREGYQTVKGLLTEDDPNGARLLQVESQFNALYTQYFSTWSVGQDAEKAFEAYVQAVQYRNQLISNYNNDYIRACTLWQRNQSLGQLLQAADNCLQRSDDSTLPAVVAFMSHAYHQARSELIHTLYLTSRAQQFWAIAPYDGLRALMGLDDPSEITASLLTVAQNQLLENFENAITAQGQVSQPFTGLQIVISDGDTLAGFRENPALLVPISPVMADTVASPGQPFAGLANVRLTTVRVYVEGARTSNDQLHVSIMHGGYETVVSQANSAMSFIHKPLSVTFQYELTQPDSISIDGTIGRTTANDNFALIGPFTTWSVKVDPGLNVGLDLSQVTQVIIEFSGTCSAFPE